MPVLSDNRFLFLFGGYIAAVWVNE